MQKINNCNEKMYDRLLFVNDTKGVENNDNK